jgi:hypothetical protein
MYDKKNAPLCPIFKLQTIVKGAGENFTELAYKVSNKTVISYGNDGV